MIKYILSPKYIDPQRGFFFKKIKSVFITYLMIFFSLILITILLDFVDSFVVETLHYPSIMQNIKSNPSLYFNLYGKAIGFLLTVFLIPFIEEVFFRLPLNLKPKNLSVVIGLFFYRIFKVNFLEFNFYKVSDYVVFISSFIVGFIAYKFFSKKKIISFLSYFRDNYFAVLFYGISIFFALLHVSILNPISEIIYIYPVFVLPQFVMALFIGAIRMKYGFIWGFLLHIIINLIPSISYLIKN